MAVDETQAAGEPSLAERLEGSFVDTRRDLEVSRHVFRGEVAYVVRDPLTASSHRLGVREYRLFNEIDSSVSLGEHAARLKETGELRAEDEESFFRFVMQLHKLGFLKLPIQDDAGLYQRHLARLAGKKKQLAMFLFSAQIPVFNPDRFLDATVRLARPLFTRTALFFWSLFVGFAIFTGIQNAHEFAEPAMNIFSGPNLPLLWVTLVGLKVFHEFGHAYACKVFGGRVPEMGIMLIAGAPLAYMDATSSWGFPKKRQRIIVCLAGMYIEVGLAAGALLLWTITPPGVLRSVLHNLVMLASITTVLMNINPLMRYDGYYALTDVLELPNMRGRATATSMGVLKRVLLGIKPPRTQDGPLLKLFLFFFGIASTVYRATIILSISTAIATKYFVAGALLGGIYIVNSLWGIFKRSIPYLARSPETASMRFRAVTVLITLFIALPVALFGVPVPGTVAAPSLLADRDELVLRAESPGFLEVLEVSPGSTIRPGEPVAKLHDPGLGNELASAEAARAAAAIRARVQEPTDPLAAKMEHQREAQAAQQVAYWQAQEAKLELVAPADLGGAGFVVHTAADTDLGRWFEVGEALVTIARQSSGAARHKALALFDATDLAGALPKPGDTAWFQPISQPELRLSACITSVTPTGSRKLSADFLEHLDLASLALNPVTGEVGQAQFVVEVELDGEEPLPYGLTGKLRLAAEPTPLGIVAMRKTLVFLAKL
jgi:putative peptide zinc metalloprotease protein